MTVDAAVTDRTTLRQRVLTAQEDLANLKAAARARVLRLRVERDWCLPGTGDVLNRLDLPPLVFTYTGTTTIWAQITDGPASWSEGKPPGGAADHFRVRSSDPDVHFDIVGVRVDEGQRVHFDLTVRVTGATSEYNGHSKIVRGLSVEATDAAVTLSVGRTAPLLNPRIE